MFAVRDTPQDSTHFTPFEMIYGHQVRTPMTLLKHLWTGEEEDPQVKTSYQKPHINMSWTRETALNTHVSWQKQNWPRYKIVINAITTDGLATEALKLVIVCCFCYQLTGAQPRF